MFEYELFAAIVEAGSLSAGGRKLGMSPAVVSKRLCRLEDRLGVRLMERSTRHLALTEGGRQFYTRAVTILESIEDAEATVSGRLAAARGALRISAPTTFGRLHLAPHLGEFLRQNPDLTVEINFSDSFVDLEAEGIDVAVRIGALQQSTPAPVWLAPNRRVLCATPGYLAEHGMPQDLPDLRRHRLLAAANQAPWRLHGPDGAVSMPVRSFVRTTSNEVIRELVLSGVGIALRSIWDVGPQLIEGTLSAVLSQYAGSPDTCIQAIRSGRRSAANSAEHFIQFLRTLYKPTLHWETREHPERETLPV